MNNLLLRPPTFVIETDVNPVTAGGLSPGWISGTPSGLADGGVVPVLFDLGPLWAQYPLLQVCITSVTGAGGSLSAITASFRDIPTASFNNQRAAASSAFQASAPAILFASISTANSAGATLVRPMGRYMIVQVTNTATFGAQGASKITVAGYTS